MKPIVSVKNLKKYYPLKKGLLYTILMGEKEYVKAVDGVSFEIYEKEIFVLAGETGSGKTTTGKVLVGLEKPTEGEIYFKDQNISRLNPKEWKRKGLRRKIQMIFQDPYESLNPRSKIYDILAEPLIVNKAVETREELDEKIMRKLEEVKLIPPDEFAFRYPHQLSGGQRQRVVIARGMILDPEFVVADEPVSMLDVSIRIDILNLLNSFREKYGVSYLYITHDLATARYIGDRIGILYLGQIVETGPVEEVIQNPKHPYTQALISAIPIPDPEYARRKEIIELKGEIPSPINPPKGCRLHPRCPFAMDICSKKEPPMIEVGKGHQASCWLYEKI